MATHNKWLTEQELENYWLLMEEESKFYKLGHNISYEYLYGVSKTLLRMFATYEDRWIDISVVPIIKTKLEENKATGDINEILNKNYVKESKK